MFRYQALILSIATASLDAQASRTTSMLPPPAKDSIYALAVKPSAYPEESYVYLLDDGVVRLDAEGRGTRTYRQVIEILKPAAVQRFREQAFSYSPGHEKLTINWLRVIRPNGEIVEQPSQIQDADIPAEMGDPVYSDVKVRRASLTGLEPGALLDYSVTTEELKPFLPGDFLLPWRVSTGAPTVRSHYVVDLPSALKARIKERNLTFKRQEQIAGERTIYTWALANVPFKRNTEGFAADSNGVTMSVTIASPLTWSSIAKWYADNARDRYAVTPSVVAKISEVVRGARTLDDSIRALHKWVAQDIRYVSIALGMGGYQPRAPETVLSTGFGDCKDKATLFIAALKHIGMTAYPVLLNSFGNVDRDLPSIKQFNHVIAAIQLPAGYHYVDMTAELTPFDQIPLPEQGEFGVVVHPDGRGEEITFPDAGPLANSDEIHIAGALSSEGLFNGDYDETVTGATAAGLRSAFKDPMDSTMRANISRQLAERFFEGASGDSLVAFNGKDFSVKPAVHLRILNGKATQSAGNTEILSLPFGSMSRMAAMAAMAQRLAKEPKREYPIDARRIFGRNERFTELRITLPPGWTAKLPPNVTASSAFGSYRSEYSQTGRELRISRTMTGATGILPPERIGELIEWLTAMGKDDAKFVVIDKTAGSN